MDDWLDDWVSKAEKRERAKKKYPVKKDLTHQHFWNPSKNFKKYIKNGSKAI